MNYSIIFTLCIFTLLANTHPAHCSIDLEFVAHLENFNQQIMDVISQSDIDPIIAQEISSQLSILSEKAVNNINEDRKDVLVANIFTSFLEIANKIVKDVDKTTLYALTYDLKYSARINSIHKLLIGLYPGTFTDQLHYTDSYTETAGFTLNALIFYKVLETILLIPSIKSVLAMEAHFITKIWIARALTGIAAHFAWDFEKKALFPKNTTPLSA